jgi:hypothetical protein
MIPTTSNSILVDPPMEKNASLAQAPGTALIGWVMGKVQSWEDHRERGYGRLWAEYWRMWRGKWAPEDANRQSERSRLIAPALAQAIEMTASEIEEALFSKDVWFDIADDTDDKDKIDALKARDLLLDDLDTVNAQDQITEAVLNSAIFGTGVVKINVFVGRADKSTRDPNTGKLEAKGDERVFVTVESIRPDEFIPDPSGVRISEMLGVAHRAKKPLHSVLEKIEEGIYLESALERLSPQPRLQNRDIDQEDPQSESRPTDSDEVDVVEYHGKVPLKLLNALQEKKDGSIDELLDFDLSEREESGDGALVEAIVTIANSNILLRAMVNPFVMTDRSIIAFQHEKVPGRFWGRGVAEKGYNPQKALDAGVRAYIDALGFVSAPMLGIDAGRIPKGFKMEVKPGKVWLTQGPPNEVLSPIKIGEVDVGLFQLSSEMERMVQMGTGAFDTAGALNSQSQSGANASSSNSMMMGAFLKRSKRSVKNVERNLVKPVIQKCLWRYMQFDAQRYPKDYDFHVKAGLGIVAREVEAMQLTQLVGMVPEQFGGVALTMAQGIIENSAVPNKATILQQINAALQPPSPEEQAKQKQLQDLQFSAARASAQGALLQNQETLARIRKLLAEANKISHEAGIEDDRVALEREQNQLALDENAMYQEQNRISLARLAREDRALDQKDRELDIKQQMVNKPASKK